ncbi:aminotransferase class V-fold PLP-dependent enzyme [Novosphingobium sp. FSY-8]|uniref:Cysteine desulfurase n=1 Tax=Novosphingobium ovatum TaxID=1908523 RepID=A0ABW9XAY7_9SPHN|nr:aminotransferase class V-fold PLP-dependent enzyme [Novosphingobium ovatum]NBC35697.1 aminotransferase class V-fold PLP-dependent enzyme [Novosphingobium ovatum]
MRHAIYLDHAATTPLLPHARAQMLCGFDLWANPSSPHAPGRSARAALEDARARIAAALGWDGEVILTSGASEALAIALTRAAVDRRIISAVEHEAVFRAAPDAAVAPIRDGLVDGDALAALLDGPGRALVAVQATNSETGGYLMHVAPNPVVQITHAAGGLVLCDDSQMGIGRSLPAGVDMAVISGHKIGGPIGIGALLVRDLAMLHPTGGQERGYRPGTENLPGALGLAAALEDGHSCWQTTITDRHAFAERLARQGVLLGGEDRADHIIAIASPRFDARALLIRLDAMGFAVSAGSACSSGSLKPSRVLQGFGIDPDVARRTIRVSLGWSSTVAELDAFADAWERLHA